MTAGASSGAAVERPAGVQPELVVLIGLQASGKTSFFRQKFLGTHVHVSKDRLRSNKAAQQDRLIRQALAFGCAVVVDNTNPTAADRAPLLALALEFSLPVTGYYFESRTADCLARNAGRGINRVPDVAILSTIKKLARPTLAEGFDRLFHVRLAPGDGDGFHVSEWQEDAP